MPFVNYLQSAVLNHVFGASTYTKPTVYVALFTSSPGPTGGGAEVAGAGYARVAYGAVTTSGGSPTQVANSADINFAAAGVAWGTVTHAALFDAASGGNMLAYGALQISKTISAGDAFRFPATALAVTLN